MNFRQILEMSQKTYSYSTTQINIEPELSKRIISFGKEVIKDSDLYTDDDCGREDNIHVTVLYGLETQNAKPVRDIISKEPKFSITFGDISFFEQDECDVMKIEIKGTELHELHQKIRKLDNQNKYPVYYPHCTIAYLKKGVKERLKYKIDEFSGLTQNVNKIEFVSKNGEKEKIWLKPF